MDCPFSPAEKEIRFLISLLNIANPGDPAPEQSRELEQLLPAEANG